MKLCRPSCITCGCIVYLLGHFLRGCPFRNAFVCAGSQNTQHWLLCVIRALTTLKSEWALVKKNNKSYIMRDGEVELEFTFWTFINEKCPLLFPRIESGSLHRSRFIPVFILLKQTQTTQCAFEKWRLSLQIFLQGRAEFMWSNAPIMIRKKSLETCEGLRETCYPQTKVVMVPGVDT